MNSLSKYQNNIELQDENFCYQINNNLAFRQSLYDKTVQCRLDSYDFLSSLKFQF